MFKYLIALPIEEPACGSVCRLMYEVASKTGINPPCWTLAPHLSFSRPVTGVAEDTLKEAVADAVVGARQSWVTFHALYPFGKQYIVLPAQSTFATAALWVGIHVALARLPGYERGPFEDDNILHITIAKDVSAVFERSWPAIQRIKLELLSVHLSEIALCRKPVEGGRWERIASFPIST